MLFPESWLGWVIAVLFLSALIFPKYMLYFLIASVIGTLLFLIIGRAYFKSREQKLYITRFTAATFFIFAIYLIYNYGKVSHVYTGIGLLIFIIGIVIGYQSLKQYGSVELHKSIYYMSYNVYGPLIFILAPVIFILMLLIGIKENRIDVPIVGLIFTSVLLAIGFWGRNIMKKELSK